MSAHSKSSHEYSESVKKMGQNQEYRKSSRRKQTSNSTKEKLPSPQAHQSSKFKEKDEVVTSFAQPYIKQHTGSRRQIADEQVVQLTSSGSFQKQKPKSKTNTEDELVRHMTNLPAYLQRVEKQKSIQEKALNFGVLDWKRLEKWKYTERMPARGQQKVSSSGSSSSTVCVPPALSKISHQRKQSSADLHLKSSQEVRLPDCALQSQGIVKHIQDSQTTSLSAVPGQKQEFCQKVKSSGRNYPETKNDKSKRVQPAQKTVIEIDPLSPNEVKQSCSQSSLPMTDKHRKKNTSKDDDTKVGPTYSADDPQHIVLLVPKFPQRSSSEKCNIAESKTPFDGELAESDQNRLSDCFSSQELQLGEFYDEIPYSCPLPASVSVAQGMQSDISTRQLQNNPLFTPRPSEAKSSNDDCSVSDEISKEKDFYGAEQPTVKGRHPSPNRRFSFSLGRLSRSFSFKESSTVPHLSSDYVAAKSGPVSSELLAGIDDSNRDKARANSRGRSSPFRRLLDPILKPKGAHSAQTVQSSYKSSGVVTTEPTNADKPLQDETLHVSTFQALLQLTIKDGLPFFKFVVNNSSDILAAAVKTSPVSEKSNRSLTYAFYSVREIKKKNTGWISHGSKDKNCSFGYHIVGQMKISTSHLSDMVRESILYNVDIGEGDKGTPKVLPNREIAAIIVKDPTEKLNGGGPKEASVQLSPGNGYARGEKENFSTMVILPGGIHSLPNEGAPSSLIDRWKSGGLCDCGGWDTGCKLRILTDQNKESRCLTTDMNCSALERIDLFNQGGEEAGHPIFSLKPFKDGFYSVQCSASIPLLEAFSICVAVITSRELPYNLHTNVLSEAKLSSEDMTQNGTNKNSNIIQGQVPAKYISSPPPSPVGRI